MLRKIAILMLILSTLTVLPNCGREFSKPVEENWNQGNLLRDDPEGLEAFIPNLSGHEELIWFEESVGTQRVVRAIIRFAPEVADRLEKNLGGSESSRISTEQWFPAELKAQATSNGGETVKGVRYDVKDLVNPTVKSGWVVRVDSTAYFIFELILN